MHLYRNHIALLIFLLTTFATSSLWGGTQLTFEERVRAQEAIERVYYEKRIWPTENPNPKPPFEDIISRQDLEAKVRDYLLKSEALREYWQRPIRADQLQAEMNRMAENTKDAGTLKELFNVLGNDPLIIAECLARPILADRLIRNWYAKDIRFHGELKYEVEALWEELTPRNFLVLGREHYHTISFELKVENPVEGTDNHNYKTVMLDNEGFSKVLADFPEDGGISSVQETSESFIIRFTDFRTERTLEGGIILYKKQPFEQWFEEALLLLNQNVTVPAGVYYIPALSSMPISLTEESWRPLYYGVGPRRDHTAVWTGSEMIIWGGFAASELNTGGRYDPTTDSWTPTSTGTNCPSARSSHTAVWTGTEMIIWGGAGGSNTGGRYDPTTDSWTPTSTGTNCPSGRGYHTAFWTGTEMIIWGGGDSNTGGRYDPTTDSWIATSTGINCPSVSIYYASVWTGTEMIIWGGYENTGDRTNRGRRYDPTTDSWTPTSTGANCPSARSGHSAVWTGSEMIIWGGCCDENTGGRYNPTTDSWIPTSTGANCPSARSWPKAVWTGSEMIIWGAVFNTGGRYNPITDSWTVTSTGTNCPSPRNNYTLLWTGSEMIIWGGIGIGGPYLNSGGRYNPTTDSWTPTSTGTEWCPSARTKHSAVWTGSEMIIWGGSDESGFAEAFKDTGGRYDPVTDSWTPTSSVNRPSARARHTTVWTGSHMIVWGGSAFGDFNTGGLYNPTTNSWTPTSTGINCPSARSAHTVVWTGSEMIIWGGALTKTGGRYNPTTDSWTPTSTGTNCPSARSVQTAVWTGSEMIVWGGYNGPYLNTGGRYNPNTDSWTTTPSGTDCPSARYLHTAVWTGSEMIVWGGFGYGEYDETLMNTGGCYNPSYNLWTPTSTGISCPSARSAHTAVWTGSEMIIWGGSEQETGGHYNQTLNDWTATSTGLYCPSGRSNHTAVWTGVEMIIWDGKPLSQNGGIYTPPCSTPISLINNTAYDINACLFNGIQILWTADAGDWGDSESGTRTYDILRDGSPIQSGIVYGTTQYTDLTGGQGTTHLYSVRYNNGCGSNAVTTGASAEDTNAAPGSPVITGILDIDTCAKNGIQIYFTSGSGATRHDLYEDAVNVVTGYLSGDFYNPDDTGVHNYIVRAINGSCWANSNLVVGVDANNTPIPTISGPGVNICPDETVTLTTESDMFNYQWFLNSNTLIGATSATIIASESGDYTVAYENVEGCFGVSTTHAVTVSPCCYSAGEHYSTENIIDNMIMVPGGSFIQGSPTTEACREGYEGFQFTHTLTRNVIIMQTEVTRQMWADLLAVQPMLPADPTSTANGAGMTNPVQNLSWYEAVLFANLLSLQNGYELCYYKDASYTVPLDSSNYQSGEFYCNFDANGYRLPTEGEWEHAARAGTTDPFSCDESNYNSVTCTSNVPGTLPTLEMYALFWANRVDLNTNPVGSKLPNPWNLYDMHGNVYEWCWDWFANYSGDKMDYSGPASGTTRISRGGALTASARGLRSAWRKYETPDTRTYRFGFRLTRTVITTVEPIPFITGASGGCTDVGVLLSTGEYAEYQWILNDEDIPGAINQTFQAMTPGIYTVRVMSSEGCEGVSDGHTITLDPNPTPSMLSTDITLCSGDGTAFSVTASGEGLTWRWRKDGTPLSEGAHYSGTATATLHLLDVTQDMAGPYDCLVTNGGCSVASPAVVLTVHPCLAPQLEAEPDYTAGTVNTIYWQTVVDATGYIVEASDDHFANVFQTSGTIIGSSHEFIGLTGGIDYQYRAQAVYPWGESEWSSQAHSTQDTDTPASIIIEPADGAMLFGEIWGVSGTASDPTSDVGLVELSWDGGATWHAATGTAEWTYDWTLPADGNYTLLCRATDLVGHEETPHGVPVMVRNRPLPPTDLVAQDVPYDGGGVIALTWTLSGDDGAGLDYIIGYGIYRANAAAGPFSQIGFVPAGTAAYEDATAGTGIDRWYKVRAITDADVWPNYADSNIAGPVAGIDNPPLPVNSLQAELTLACNVRLFWTESPSPDILLYNIYYDAGTGTIDWVTPIGTVNAPNTTWVSSGLALNTRYSFAVRAKDLAGQEDELTSNIVSIVTDCTVGQVRAVIHQPQAGRRIKGTKVTVKAHLIQGTSGQTAFVLLQYRLSSTTEWLDMVPNGNGPNENPDPIAPYLIHWDVSVLPDGDYDLRAVAYDLTLTPDPSPPFVTVTVANGGNANIAENNINGNHHADIETYKGSGNSNVTAFERDSLMFQVNVPKGSLPRQIETMNLRDVDPATYNDKTMTGMIVDRGEKRVSIGTIIPADMYRSVLLAEDQVSFSSGVDLIFYYSDDNRDYIIDGTTIVVTQLDVFRDEGNNQWGLQNTNRTVDTVNQYVRVTVNQTGTYGLFTFPKPASVVHLMVTRSNADAVLTWQAVTTDDKGNSITVDHYNVYASSEPDFYPDLVNGSNRIGQPVGISFPHTNALTHPEDYYYLVTAVDGTGRESYPR